MEEEGEKKRCPPGKKRETGIEGKNRKVTRKRGIEKMDGSQSRTNDPEKQP